MEKFEAIFERKSVRDYSSDDISEEGMSKIKDEISELSPLYEDIKSEIFVGEYGQKVQETFSGLKSKIAKVESPHYLIGTSESKEGYLENMGYILEELVLSLTQKELASCWLGAGLNEDLLEEIYDFEYDFVIMVAFGQAAKGKKNLRPDPNKAKRKPIDELILNDTSELSKEWKKIMEAVRLAPSALNGQPWRFYFDERGVHLFIDRGGILKSTFKKITDLNKLNRIDAGIALKHLEIAAKKYSVDVKYENVDIDKKGLEYIISVI